MPCVFVLCTNEITDKFKCSVIFKTSKKIKGKYPLRLAMSAAMSAALSKALNHLR